MTNEYRRIFQQLVTDLTLLWADTHLEDGLYGIRLLDAVITDCAHVADYLVAIGAVSDDGETCKTTLLGHLLIESVADELPWLAEFCQGMEAWR